LKPTALQRNLVHGECAPSKLLDAISEIYLTYRGNA
jgi:hypothetical protein